MKMKEIIISVFFEVVLQFFYYIFQQEELNAIFSVFLLPFSMVSEFLLSF